jgi:hypothetical protein
MCLFKCVQGIRLPVSHAVSELAMIVRVASSRQSGVHCYPSDALRQERRSMVAIFR